MEDNKRKRKTKNILIIVAIVIVISLLLPYTRCYIATSLYTFSNKQATQVDDLFEKVSIPSGSMTKENDWYRKMVWFSDQSFSDAYDVTVLYSYGYFNGLLGTSRYYDQRSPYYGGFYGGYFITGHNDNAFGFKGDGTINPEEIYSIAKHDQVNLVLPALGCDVSRRHFEIDKIDDIVENISFGGYDDWTRIDSHIVTNGPAHERSNFEKGYFQYGLPLKPIAESERKQIIEENESKKGYWNYGNTKDYSDFALEYFVGRVYVRYFKEYKTTVCLYIMAIDEEVVNQTDENILRKSIIK